MKKNKNKNQPILVDVCLSKEDAENGKYITMLFSEFIAFMDGVFGRNQNIDSLYVKRHEVE